MKTEINKQFNLERFEEINKDEVVFAIQKFVKFVKNITSNEAEFFNKFSNVKKEDLFGIVFVENFSEFII
jgi:hypothetical protein